MYIQLCQEQLRIQFKHMSISRQSALNNLQARPAPAGEMPVVLGPGWPGILLHEAVGHGLEGDFNRKGSSAFAGRIGQRVAARIEAFDDELSLPVFSLAGGGADQ